MTKKIKLSIALFSILYGNSLFATEITDTEELLKKSTNFEFKCSKTQCISENITIEDKDKKLSIKNIKIDFTKDLFLKFDLEKANKLYKESIKSCNGDITCEKEKTYKIYAEGNKELWSQTKSIKISDFKTFDKRINNSLLIKEIKLDIDSNLLNLLNKDLDKLTIQDLKLNSTLQLIGISNNKDINLIKTLELVLPKSTTISYNRKTGKYDTEKIDFIDEINKYIKDMYKDISSQIKLKNISDMDINIKTTPTGKDLILSTNVNSKDNISGKTDFNINFKFKNIIENINTMKSMKENKMFLISTLSTNVILEDVSIKNEIEYLFNIHTKLLNSNIDYKNRYLKILDLLKKNEGKLTYYQNFEYKLFSLQYKTAELSIKNKSNMQIMQLLSSIKNKNLFDVKETFK